MTTKILALTEALAISSASYCCPDRASTSSGAAPLIDGLEFGALIAYTIFDSNEMTEMK